MGGRKTPGKKYKTKFHSRVTKVTRECLSSSDEYDYPRPPPLPLAITASGTFDTPTDISPPYILFPIIRDSSGNFGVTPLLGVSFPAPGKYSISWRVNTIGEGQGSMASTLLGLGGSFFGRETQLRELQYIGKSGEAITGSEIVKVFDHTDCAWSLSISSSVDGFDIVKSNAISPAYHAWFGINWLGA